MTGLLLINFTFLLAIVLCFVFLFASRALTKSCSVTSPTHVGTSGLVSIDTT